MTRKAALILVLLALIVAISALIGPGSPLTVVEAQPAQVAQIVPQQISGLGAAVRIVTDSDGVPHIFAQTDHDGYLVLGYLHARDRLFQMDTSRRLFSGTLSELLGQSALPSDVQLRALGVRRSAEESLPAYAPQTRALLQAYADGINSYLAEGHPLPPEYAALELTTVAPWTPADALTVAKGLAFGLSFDVDDLSRTTTLTSYLAAGGSAGFDGMALFEEDLFRSAPFDPTVSIPSAMSAPSAPTRSGSASKEFPEIRPAIARLAAGYLEKIRSIEGLESLLSAGQRRSGSNWWLISADRSESGNALFANDPHLSLDSPATFYEAHLTVADDPALGPMNVNGVTFPGAPTFVQGCNDRICWGSTVNPMDVTDFFSEELLIGDSDDETPITCSLLGNTFQATRFRGEEVPVQQIGQRFLVNRIDGTPDNPIPAPIGTLDGGCTFITRHGPVLIVNADLLAIVTTGAATGISVQYTGMHVTREGEAFFRMSRSRNLKDFREALQYFDVGSQNFGYADVDGNIAYFTSAELPIREDLQAGAVDGGVPPWLVRDGVAEMKGDGSFNRHEWSPVANRQPGQAIEFEILPFDEMPQVVNPAQGFIANANNDPIGTTLDNNVLNQMRPGGGIFYLNPGYTSPRVGRITRLIEGVLLTDFRDFRVDDMIRIQRNHQLLDAEVFTPFILTAFANAGEDGASEALTNLAADPRVVEAIGRLASWDFSTPTGIREGYDPGDDPENLPEPSPEEISSSVAATIYALWRGQFIQSTIDSTLANVGLEGLGPGSERSLSALRHLLDNYDTNQGVGASGIDFFSVEGISSPDEERDILILQSLSNGLDLLASAAFAPAFGNSTNQDDYRWGRLHRIVFDHLLGGPFDVPPAGGFSDLSAELPGVARSGGYESVDASSHSARADGVNEFMFGSGSARRFVGEMAASGIEGLQIIPGGQSGVLGDDHFSDQLSRWLTGHHHPLRLTEQAVEADRESEAVLSPERYELFFPFYQGDSDRFTAFAAANVLSSSTAFTLEAWSPGGQPASFARNPADIDLSSGEQFALLGNEIFGEPIETLQDAWAEVSVRTDGDSFSLHPFIASFSQFGGFDLGQLDGAVALTSQSRRLIFTRALQGIDAFQGREAATWLSIANPNAEEIEVEFTLRATDTGGGAADPPTAVRTIPGKGFLFESVGQLFDGPTETRSPVCCGSDGYIEATVQRGSGAVGFEVVRFNGGLSAIGLNASSGSGVETSYSAQLASSADIFTSIKVINTSDFERTVVLEAVPEGEEDPFAAEPIVLAAGESFTSNAAPLFLATLSKDTPRVQLGFPLIGSLNVTADGPGVVGDVVFGSPADLSFAAALSLQTRRFKKAVFGHVANLGDFFTGLAFYNPNEVSTVVTIEVFSGEGESKGVRNLTLGPGERDSQTLVQLIPETAGQAGGYILVTSEQPIVGQEIFGKFDLSVQSAVPPTIID